MDPPTLLRPGARLNQPEAVAVWKRSSTLPTIGPATKRDSLPVSARAIRARHRAQDGSRLPPHRTDLEHRRGAAAFSRRRSSRRAQTRCLARSQPSSRSTTRSGLLTALVHIGNCCMRRNPRDPARSKDGGKMAETPASSSNSRGDTLFNRRDALRYGMYLGAGLSGFDLLSACGSSSSQSSTTGAGRLATAGP